MPSSVIEPYYQRQNTLTNLARASVAKEEKFDAIYEIILVGACTWDGFAVLA
jgi:hypothetical protein